MKQYARSGAVWEDLVGYSRAVRCGNIIEVSGTTSVRDGEVVGEGDAAIQTRHILTIIKSALESLGSSMEDVVRTRIYVTDISQWEAIGRSHAEFFRNIKPAATMVEVKALIDPKLLVEIEATAIIDLG